MSIMVLVEVMDGDQEHIVGYYSTKKALEAAFDNYAPYYGSYLMVRTEWAD